MKLKQYLSGIEYKNKIRNLIISNTRYNHITPIQSIKCFNPSIFSPINDAKINIDSIKHKYGYMNNNSSKNILDKISKIKEKYFQDYSKNNLKIDSKNLTILGNSKKINNINLSKSSSVDKNICENNFQFEKQNSIDFNKGKVEFIIKKENEKINNENEKIHSPFIINKVEFSIIDNMKNENLNNTNKINNKEQIIIKSNNKEESYYIKERKFKYIYPISKRIKLLKNIKQNIDQIYKSDNKTILINSHSNKSLGSSYIYQIKNIPKISIFDEVFKKENQNEKVIKYRKKIDIPILLKSKSKPKPNILTYYDFMKK